MGSTHLRASLLLPVALAGALHATAAGLTASPLLTGAQRTERQTYVMGTRLRAEVLGMDRATGMGVLEAAFREVGRLDSLLSTWTAHSELQRVNDALPGHPSTVSAQLLSLLEETQEWREATWGAFDPAVGAIIDAWDLRGRGRIPSAAEVRDAVASSGPGAFQLEPSTRTVTRVQDGAWLDSGGFGKGAALRRVREVLRAAHVDRALFDFGGQLLALGSAEAESGWRIGVAHPERREESVAELRIRDVSVATTSASERRVEAEGQTLGHVVDPRTGYPVPPWGSVTVVAEDPLVADILSTALFVLGPQEAWEWAESRDDVGALFLVYGDGRLTGRWNQAMTRWLTKPPPTGGSRDALPEE